MTTTGTNRISMRIEDAAERVREVIIGKEEVIRLVFASFLAGGHVLIEDVPGVGKTTLAKAVAKAIGCSFNRIQFTPDLLPSDVTGISIYSQKTGEFSFRPGPVFANVILADEINRATPKTQSALLEAMQEHKVTAAGVTYKLEEPFFVMATQNPIEQEGTYPLPEAQLDRFMFNLWLDYPAFDEEIKIIKQTTSNYKPQLNKILNADDIIFFQDFITRVPVADNVIEYAVKFVKSTRPVNGTNKFIKDWISWGAGPRASQYLILAAKTKAVMEGRFTPSIDDVRAFLIPVLRHRIIPNFSAQAEGIDSVEIIKRLDSDENL
ncbi:MAG TPA: AAA family ATPase [Armatimonadota bacterium]|nr:AAA family ATPase [Armatimonadota bacterium]